MKELILLKQVHPHWYFSSYFFKFQPNVCNRCHDLLRIFMNLNNIAILNIKGFDYCYIICLINKSEAINLMQNAALTKEKQSIIKYKNLEILTFGDIETERKQTLLQ